MGKAIDLRKAKDTNKVSPAELRKMKAHEEVIHNIHQQTKMAPEELHLAGAVMDSRNARPDMAMGLDRPEPKNQIEYLQRDLERRDDQIRNLQEALIDVKLELLNCYRIIHQRG